MGLFDRPEQIRAAQAAQRAQNPLQTLAGSLFNLGNTGGNAAIRGLFDADTRSPAEVRAAEMQKLTQGLNPLDNDSMLQSIKQLSDAGYRGAAFQLFGMLPQQGKREIRKSADDRQRFVDDQSLVFPNVTPTSSQSKPTFRNFFNPETGNTDVWRMEDGQKVENLGIAKPAKDDSINWQFTGERERKNGELVSTRFNPKDDSAKGTQMLIDTKDGPKWVPAESGLRRSIERTQEVPISTEGSKIGQNRVKALIAADKDLNAFFKGLSLRERNDLSARINDFAEKLVKDNRDLSLDQARDKAFLIAKEHWVKRNTFLGFETTLDLKTPEEIQNSNDGFRVVE